MMVNLPLLEMMVPLLMQMQTLMKLQMLGMNSVVEAGNAINIILPCFIRHSVKQSILPPLNKFLQGWPVNPVAITAVWKLVNTSS